MKTSSSFSQSLASSIIAFGLASSACGSDAASTAPPKVGIATLSTNSIPASETGITPAVADSTVAKRLEDMGFRAKDMKLELREPAPKLQTSGFLPALFSRDGWAGAFDSINPFGSTVPKGARPNAILLVGDGPPPAGLRNEISHEPVGFALFGASR
jgi:hypothetical protein